MDLLKKLFVKASKDYNSSTPHYDTCRQLALHCHGKLTAESRFGHYGYFNGRPPVPYSVFALSAESVSRPVRGDLYIADNRHFHQEHDDVISMLRDVNHRWNPDDHERANRVVYTAIMSLACCFDLWQRSSRKTPGTFFEVFVAGLLQSVFPDAVFSKHISLASIVHDVEVAPEPLTGNSLEEESDEKASVSTDIVIGIRGRPGGVVVPLKITTRERIVQPFAHQRILDSAFGEGYYRSLIVCISETQLDDKTKSVKQVCVPGTIKLFQKYLAPVAGLYYCDLPQRYAAQDMKLIVNVRSVGHFFVDLRAILTEIKAGE